MDAVASPPFLSVAQLGERLGVSTRTAYNLVNAGEVPVIELNGLKRIPAAALDQWLADRAAEALAAVRPDGRGP
jgi:excisionase family DNA binding protein